MVQWTKGNLPDPEEGKQATVVVDSNPVGDGQRTHFWRCVYFGMLLGYIASCLGLASLEKFDCSDDEFLLVWWIVNGLFILVGTVIESAHVRRIDSSAFDVKSHCPVICDYLLVVWGIIGILGYYMVDHHVDTKCSNFQWVCMLVWSIITIVIMVVGRALVRICYGKPERTISSV